MKLNQLYVDNHWGWVMGMGSLCYSLCFRVSFTFSVLKDCFCFVLVVPRPYALFGLIPLVSLHIKISSMVNRSLPPSCFLISFRFGFQLCYSFEIALAGVTKDVHVPKSNGHFFCLLFPWPLSGISHCWSLPLAWNTLFSWLQRGHTLPVSLQLSWLLSMPTPTLWFWITPNSGIYISSPALRILFKQLLLWWLHLDI